MRLSEHFTVEEFEFSQQATRFGIKNIMTTKAQLLNAKALCQNCLEYIRTGLNRPVFMTSGYRNLIINRMVGGADSSQHPRGQAADIHVSGMTIEELFIWIIKSGIVFDQIIQEFNGWVHISYRWDKPNRRSILRATHNSAGKVVYTRVNESALLAA
jgi:zinc D-Ala-D-Ala carboxypeptidase